MRLRTIAAGAVTLALALAVPFAAGATARAAEPLARTGRKHGCRAR